jgi:hypothetical protein
MLQNSKGNNPMNHPIQRALFIKKKVYFIETYIIPVTMFHDGNWFMQDGYFGDHLCNNSIVMCLCIAKSLCAIVLTKLVLSIKKHFT